MDPLAVSHTLAGTGRPAVATRTVSDGLRSEADHQHEGDSDEAEHPINAETEELRPSGPIAVHPKRNDATMTDNRGADADTPQIVVVGAGAAGLAAAWSLAARSENNCRITVLEASDKIGGRMYCEEIDGFHVHTGASVIHESFTTTRDMARALGVEMQQSPKQKGGQSYADGRFWEIYAGGSLRQTLITLRTMFYSPLNSLRGMWELMRLFRLLKKRAKDLDFEDHARMLDLDSGESLAEFARANSLTRYMKQAGELDINCFTASSSEEVGAGYGLALLWLWTINPATRSYLPRQGIGAFARALVDETERFVRVSSPVERIVMEDRKATGVVTTSGEKLRADAVICATTASTASRIIPESAQELSAQLERINYSSCCYVAFGLETNILAEGSHAGLFPPGSPTFLTMVTNLVGMAAEAAPPGKSLVHTLVIDKHARELFAFSDDEIVRRVIQEMRRFFPAMTEHPLFARVYRWHEAMCLAPGGVLRDMFDMGIPQPRGIRGLFLAGDYTRLPSLNGALKSGVEAAEASWSYVASLGADQA